MMTLPYDAPRMTMGLAESPSRPKVNPPYPPASSTRRSPGRAFEAADEKVEGVTFTMLGPAAGAGTGRVATVTVSTAEPPSGSVSESSMS